MSFLCVIHGPQNCMKWMKNSKWVCSGNTTITNCREPRGTARKSRSTITRHQEDKLSKVKKVLLDAGNSNFACFYCVLIQSVPLTSSCEKNCPFWLWLNGQTTDSDNCFWLVCVTIFKRFFLTLKGIHDDWKADSWCPSTHIVFRKQNNVKTLLSDMKMLAFQYIETVLRFFLHVSWTF